MISLDILFLNAIAMLFIYSLTLVQMYGWKKSFKNNWNLDIQLQYNQMQSSVFRYSNILLVTFCAVLISFVGFSGFIKILRRIRWMSILVKLGIIACFSFIVVIFVFPSKSAQIVVQSILEVSIFYLN
jgi:hypothetical protein